MYIVGIRRARSIFMQNCGYLLPFCEELLTGLFCSISKTTNVIRTRVFYVHFSQWELLMSRTNNHVTHTLPFFTGLGNFSNWFWGENDIHVLTSFIKQNSKYIYIEPELNIKTIKLKPKRGSISEYCEFQTVLSPFYFAPGYSPVWNYIWTWLVHIVRNVTRDVGHDGWLRTHYDRNLESKMTNWMLYQNSKQTHRRCWRKFWKS